MKPGDNVNQPDGIGARIQLADTDQKIACAAEELVNTTGPVAIDAERSDSFHYGQDAKLIQIKRGAGTTWLIDPIRPLTDIAAAIQNVPWIIHAGMNDYPSLAEAGLRWQNLTDTEIAAQLAGEEKIGLAPLVKKYFGVEMTKEYQRADWSRRPIPDSWLAYAAADVEYLRELAEILNEILVEQGRDEWLRQEMREFENWRPGIPDTQPWLEHAHRAEFKTPYRYTLLREFWIARDKYAKQRDLAPGRVVSNKALVAAAASGPNSTRDLYRILKENNVWKLQRAQPLKKALWAVMDGSIDIEERPGLPRSLPRDGLWRSLNPEAADRYRQLHETIAELANQLGIKAHLILSAPMQRQLAWENPDNPGEYLRAAGARPWQIELLENEIG